MSYEENRISLINELGFYELNEEKEIELFLKTKKIPILTNSAKEKIFVTIILILLIRIGNFIEIPGINKNVLFNLTNSTLFLPQMGNIFPRSVPSLFSLGIGPSINASIIIQLFVVINPELKKFQKEEGEAGRRKISQYTRYLTLVLALLQSVFLVFSFKAFFYNWNIQTLLEASCLLTTGSMITLWISEKITKNGITNGSSLLVFLNIIVSTPQQFQLSLPYFSFYKVIVVVITLITSMTGVILLQQSVRWIPIMSSKILTQKSETNFFKQKAFFPVKLNQAGVMPIVFASYFLPFLKLVMLFILTKINNIFQISFILPNFLNQFIYFSTEFLLICLFTSFYSLLIVDAKDISENLQKTAFFIPGIRPGKQTLFFLEKVFQRQTLLGGIILAANTVLLNFIGLVLNLPFLQGIGIGSQIIIVGVTIEVIQKIRALMISEVYKKYLKSKNYLKK